MRRSSKVLKCRSSKVKTVVLQAISLAKDIGATEIVEVLSPIVEDKPKESVNNYLHEAAAAAPGLSNDLLYKCRKTKKTQTQNGGE